MSDFLVPTGRIIVILIPILPVSTDLRIYGVKLHKLSAGKDVNTELHQATHTIQPRQLLGSSCTDRWTEQIK